MLESAIVVYDGDVVSISKGNPCSVDFDFDQVWEYKKKIGKVFDPGYLIWAHVHPPGFGTQPSSVDLLCAAALSAAFGKVNYFGIICFDDGSFSNILGRVSWYRFEKNTLILTDNRDFSYDFILNDEEAYMLKALSYGDMWGPKHVSGEEKCLM